MGWLYNVNAFLKRSNHLLLFYQCLLLLQARHGQLNAMGWFGNIGIALPAGPSELQSNPDAMLTSEHLLFSNCLPMSFNHLPSVFQLFSNCLPMSLNRLPVVLQLFTSCLLFVSAALGLQRLPLPFAFCPLPSTHTSSLPCACLNCSFVPCLCGCLTSVQEKEQA